MDEDDWEDRLDDEDALDDEEQPEGERSLPSPDGAPECVVGDEAAPTPGERLFYALGQLYRRWREGGLDVEPAAFDIKDLASIIGVWRDVEFVQRDAAGDHYHFGSEVLFVRVAREFPWRLLDIWEWGVEQELNDLWPGTAP